MTYWDKITNQNKIDGSLITEISLNSVINEPSNQNKIDGSLITELSDISYSSIGGKRQATRKGAEEIVNLATFPFEANPPSKQITREMIMEYQKDQDKPYIDPLTGEQFKYHPTTFKFDIADLKAPVFNADANLGRPATDIDIKNYETQIKKTNNITATND